jgi:transcriptional regulator with GAF, ATPase, and Fis domain
MSREATDPPADSPAELQRSLAELGNLYEVARSLLGARDPERVASRMVLACMGTFGAVSGAMFIADDRGRFRLAYAYGPHEAAAGETLPLDAPAREWILREGVFALAGPAATRSLGAARERLAERHGAAMGAAVADPHGLAGLLVLGPRLIPHPYDADDRAMLDALAGLAALALDVRAPRARAGTPRAQPARRTPRSLRALREHHPALEPMVGESAALLETCEDLIAVARTRFPVLLSGESGVGKELAAQAIHAMSDRATGPFELVDCGSIPRELIESELFGHVRGAFTGAHRDRRGAFEIAHRGTLFLDEIGEMPLQLQTRLLRFIQEGRFRRVGDERPIESDVRIVAATNRDLRAEVAARRFREDLFYRLNVFAVRLPPLRERPDDIEPLVRHFLPRLDRGAEWAIDDEALAALRTHRWPGNVRELANICATLAVRADGAVAGCAHRPARPARRMGDRAGARVAVQPDRGLAAVAAAEARGPARTPHGTLCDLVLRDRRDPERAGGRGGRCGRRRARDRRGRGIVAAGRGAGREGDRGGARRGWRSLRHAAPLRQAAGGIRGRARARGEAHRVSAAFRPRGGDPRARFDPRGAAGGCESRPRSALADGPREISSPRPTFKSFRPCGAVPVRRRSRTRDPARAPRSHA